MSTLPTLEEDLLKELQALGLEPKRVIEEFDLLSISDDAAFLAREIAKKVKERVKEYAQLLEELLIPDSGLSSLNECGFFTEQERTGLGKSYRELMALLRRFTLADLDATPTAYRDFVTTALPRWETQKALLRTAVEKLEREWRKEEPVQSEQSYLG